MTRAVVLGAPFAGTPRGACVEGSFASAHVPAFAGNPVTVSKSFAISPAQSPSRLCSYIAHGLTVMRPCEPNGVLPVTRCSKDSDCEGDLLCEGGRCVGPK